MDESKEIRNSDNFKMFILCIVHFDFFVLLHYQRVKITRDDIASSKAGLRSKQHCFGFYKCTDFGTVIPRGKETPIVYCPVRKATIAKRLPGSSDLPTSLSMNILVPMLSVNILIHLQHPIKWVKDLIISGVMLIQGPISSSTQLFCIHVFVHLVATLRRTMVAMVAKPIKVHGSLQHPHMVPTNQCSTPVVHFKRSEKSSMKKEEKKKKIL
ncbi:hypothetical protein WN51_13875 [Melipona quadrifasciata]|uniref:Uncharacterized protein n=1 Tax=Melipona quadrifasciata TaxID=166423 RepID=A0A0M8ZZ05_9HYME|nr:hypothetical protein WN51_13875 [Melipona quadrifasciata]